jgi:hypothetical protein
MSRLEVAVVLVVALAGCTRWSTTSVYGPQREVGRTLLGSPAIAESKSSQLAAGFSGRASGGSAVGGLGGNMESVTLKHCVQKADVALEQPYEQVPELRGRGWDVAGAVTLGIFGATAIDVGYRNDNDQYRESSGTTNYVVGGVLLAAGVGILYRAYGVVPNRRPAPSGPLKREWTEQRLVESSGCGMPGDVAQVQSPVPLVIQAQPEKQDAAARLQQLDKLRASGAISDADYARKRKEIIDGI